MNINLFIGIICIFAAGAALVEGDGTLAAIHFILGTINIVLGAKDE